MRFSKMHVAGAEYLCVDCLRKSALGDLTLVGPKLAARHLDGGPARLVLLGPSVRGDARLYIFDSRGAALDVCAAGGAAAARFLHDHGSLRKPRLTLETGAGITGVELTLQNGKVERVRLDLGRPTVHPPVEMPITFPDTMHNVTRVSLGAVPHSVLFVPEVTGTLVHGIGPQIEKHPSFPQRSDVVFARVNRRDDVSVRVWQRDVGETPACGNGACAVAVAGALAGRTQRRLTAHLPGGEVEVHWSDHDDDHVFLIAPAVEVSQGEWPDET